MYFIGTETETKTKSSILVVLKLKLVLVSVGNAGTYVRVYSPGHQAEAKSITGGYC